MQGFLQVLSVRKDREGPREQGAEIPVLNPVIYCNQSGTMKAKHKHNSEL